MEQRTRSRGSASFRERMRALEQKVHDERAEMLATDGAKPMEVDRKLMKKYNIFSRSTIWTYCRRVEERNAPKTTVINT